MAMFPLGAVLMPGETLALKVFEPRYAAMIDDLLTAERDPEFGVVLIARGHEVGGGDVRTDIGVTARVTEVIDLPGRQFRIRAVGGERFRVLRWLPDDPYPRAEIEWWPDGVGGDDSALLAGLRERLTTVRSLTTELTRKAGIRRTPPTPDLDKLPADPSARSFAVADRLPIGAADRHDALAAPDPLVRLQGLTDALDDVIATLRFRLL
ncbi:LON peptidase substrate-binding domain-containing protein [Nocardia thailandica]|uniref:LON peptidase substrate-binding domain-containing protein n=1 Tax=Nocardia thailandica TaxID=257275 RepID=UPI001FDF7138|nr:LON peptidase substrate-binding domain-containing protein [Nocardia thailandica]